MRETQVKKAVCVSTLLVILALVLAACEGGATATGIQNQCRTSGSGSTAGGSCQVTIGTITGGAFGFKVENDSFRTATRTVDVRAQISVGQGTLAAWVEGPDNQRTAVTVEPGQTIELSGLAQVTGTSDNKSFRIYLEPQGEGDAKRVEDVSMQLEYTTVEQ